MILAHNHPSGDPTPSLEDETFTRELRRYMQSLGISLRLSGATADKSAFATTSSSAKATIIPSPTQACGNSSEEQSDGKTGRTANRTSQQSEDRSQF